MGATNLQNGDEITYKKILMFISMTMITSQKCRVINENLHIRGTISVKSVATYLWSQLTYDHKRRISLTWKVSHKLRQEKWNPKLKFQTGRPPIDFIFKPVPIYIYIHNVINMILVSKMRKSQTTVSIYLINMSNFGGLRTPIVWTGPSQNATPPAPHFWIGFPPEVALISVCNWSRSAEQPRLVDPNGGSASSFEFPRRSSISSNDNGAACLWFV